MTTLYCLVGIPASGKSTFANEHINENTIWISSDNIRKEIYGAETHQDNNIEVFEMMYKRTKEALNSGVNVIYDATNISIKKRKSLIYQLEGIKKICVYFEVDLNEAIERNAKRERKVPVHIINEMYKDLQIPTHYEGWDEIKIIKSRKI
ncbi:AAA family ATPase [uncultured Clostridium sp.]|jgi:predicted kinase|uniref:AAA family ATPase n=1 Tax=uncultured Clostridium sp. TaxID=59620 RepID=UPI00260E2B1C|nr:AAA family ATPase [uncultured Clostridium sp.]